jgi:hypothetical protein
MRLPQERASAVDKLKPHLMLKNKLIGSDPYYAKVVSDGNILSKLVLIPK